MKLRMFLLFFIPWLLGCHDRQGEPGPQPETFTGIPADSLVSNVPQSDSLYGNESQTWHFPYNLPSPDDVFKLPHKLREISGLSLSPDKQSLIAVNDEEGIIYYLDKKTGKIINTLPFGKAGDYEGIETAGHAIYVVKSNGTIYQITPTGRKEPDTKHYNTFLNASNNVEGLAFDSFRNRLLVACKGTAGEGAGTRGKRAIFGFDLDNHVLQEDPVYLLDQHEIGSAFKREDGLIRKLSEILSPDLKIDAFAPSGIAIHPETSDIYLISSVGKLLIVLHPDGGIRYMEKLDTQHFSQPEGICFDTEGTLYISSEGKHGKAKLLRFVKR